MEALILAAGRGKRLYPITRSMPKPMVKINGKPILHYILNALKLIGIKKIIIVIGYMGDSIKKYFKNGKEYGIKIDYLFQENYEGGTGNAVGLAKNLIKLDKFLLIFGDNLFNPNILHELFEKKEIYNGVLCCKKLLSNDFGGWVEVSNDKIVNIKEGKNIFSSNLQNQGLMILPREIFSAIESINISSRGELELTDAIQSIINNGLNLGYILTNYEILNISSENDLKTAESVIKNFNI